MASATNLEIDPLFHDAVELVSTDARVALSYKRARLLMNEYGSSSFLYDALLPSSCLTVIVKG